MPAIDADRHHIFLSHVWKGNGQDVVRIIKERLTQLVPGIKVFLDVDDVRCIPRCPSLPPRPSHDCLGSFEACARLPALAARRHLPA